MSAAEVLDARLDARPRPRFRMGRFLGSELRLIAGRRRNIAGLGVLAAVPIIIAIAASPKPTAMNR